MADYFGSYPTHRVKDTVSGMLVAWCGHKPSYAKVAHHAMKAGRCERCESIYKKHLSSEKRRNRRKGFCKTCAHWRNKPPAALGKQVGPIRHRIRSYCLYQPTVNALSADRCDMWEQK